jgi:uncharacterized membrane protein
MNLGDTIAASFNEVVNDLVTALPSVIGALLILLVGYVIARVVSGLVGKLLSRGGADKAFARHGGAVYGERANAFPPSRMAALITFWVIMLVFLIAAASFLGWPQVSNLLDDFVGWLPNLVVAVIILVAAPIVARIVRGAVESGSAQTGMGNGRLLGRIAEIAIIGFAVVVAINQVGIASDLVNILFIGLVFALALAFGLAFGLGGREVAGQVTQDWYRKSKETADRARMASAESQYASTQFQPGPPTTPPHGGPSTPR